MGGKLVMPVGGEARQRLLCVTRTGDDAWTEVGLGEVRFVPLIGAHGS
jgi:protein-L-isoaspartate(D-aspartate) O-methyltransferase